MLDIIERYLAERNIPYEREKILPSSFVGEKGKRDIADFVIDNKIVIELKTRRVLTREDYYQVGRYLEATNLKLGILVNFREKYLKPRRILNPSSNHSQLVD